VLRVSDGKSDERVEVPAQCAQVIRSAEWTPKMDSMANFFEALFADFPDLEIPLDSSDNSFVVLYTNASNSTRFSGLGAVLIDNASGTRLMSQATVPQSILSRLADEVTAPINHLEILAMLCALVTFRHELRGRRVYWGVDNTTALSAALHGYTPSPSMNPLVNALHIALAHLQCDVHFEYVPSAANPADLPSRDPASWSSADEQVLANLKLLGPASQRTMRIPSLEELDDHKNALKNVAQACSSDD